jgi:hypothetical protein
MLPSDGVTATGFTVLHADVPRELAAWQALWSASPYREPFAHAAYVALGARSGERALCLAWREPDGATIMYPLLLRDIAAAPGESPLRDVVSPYGYGGPYAWRGGRRPAVAARFWEEFDRWAARERVVSEFVRFSLFDEQLAPHPGEHEERLRNVVRSLALDDDDLARDVEHKVRKNVRRAQAAGLRVEIDPAGERLDDFVRIYDGTMDRRAAAGSFYFGRDYFARLGAELGAAKAYVHVLHEERVVSTELVLLSSDHAYSFLGGTEAEAFPLRPNDLLKWELIRWARDTGRSAYVLGGGPRPDDGIFRYKAAFAPNGLVPFRVGRRVLDPEAYARLEAERDLARSDQERARVAADRPFPSYRF